MTSCGVIWNQKKRIIPFVASIGTKINRMLRIVYDSDIADDMYIGICLLQQSISPVLKKKAYYNVKC